MNKTIILFGTICIIITITFFYLQSIRPTQKANNSHINNQSEVIQLKFAHHMPQESITHKAALRFADEVEKKQMVKLK